MAPLNMTTIPRVDQIASPSAQPTRAFRLLVSLVLVVVAQVGQRYIPPGTGNSQVEHMGARQLEHSLTAATPGPDAAPVPTDAFRLSDVEASAVEAGISRQFVAIALAERSAAAGSGVAVEPLDARSEQRIAPLCPLHHQAVHDPFANDPQSVERLSHRGFYEKHGVDLWGEAEPLPAARQWQLRALRPDLFAAPAEPTTPAPSAAEQRAA
jgi:hypothetical protein